MLAVGARLRRAREFEHVVRCGVRAGRPRLVVHLLVPCGRGRRADAPTRAGFVVSRAVGGAVTRNRVRRRLRSLVRDRLATLPPGSCLVVRAAPAAASADFQDLARDLDSALARAVRLGCGRAP